MYSESLMVNLTGHESVLVTETNPFRFGFDTAKAEEEDSVARKTEGYDWSHMPSIAVDDRSQQSSKRRAAEAALASIYNVDRSNKKARMSPDSSKPPQPDALSLQSCNASCICQRQGSNAEASTSQGWCKFGIKLPHINWKSVVDNAPINFAIQGPESLCPSYFLDGGIKVIVVECLMGIAPALAELRLSMQDPYVALDLEWRPEFGKGQQNKVAMIQLASSTVAVLIRTSKLGFKLEPTLEQFLRDPNVVLIGFSWDSADEKKFRQTFQFGRSMMPHFLDLQSIGGMLGYRNYGLGSLSQQVMGVQMKKSKKLTMSNWEAFKLKPKQLMYAALDALVAGATFRALRLWHSLPSDCSMCRVPLGAVIQAPSKGLRMPSEESCYSSEDLGWSIGFSSLSQGAHKCLSCGRQTCQTLA